MNDMDLPYLESDKDFEDLSQKATHRNIGATNEKIKFFKSTIIKTTMPKIEK